MCTATLGTHAREGGEPREPKTVLLRPHGNDELRLRLRACLLRSPLLKKGEEEFPPRGVCARLAQRARNSSRWRGVLLLLLLRWRRLAAEAAEAAEAAAVPLMLLLLLQTASAADASARAAACAADERTRPIRVQSPARPVRGHRYSARLAWRLLSERLWRRSHAGWRRRAAHDDRRRRPACGQVGANGQDAGMIGKLQQLTSGCGVGGTAHALCLPGRVVVVVCSDRMVRHRAVARSIAASEIKGERLHRVCLLVALLLARRSSSPLECQRCANGRGAGPFVVGGPLLDRDHTLAREGERGKGWALGGHPVQVTNHHTRCMPAFRSRSRREALKFARLRLWP